MRRLIISVALLVVSACQTSEPVESTTIPPAPTTSTSTPQVSPAGGCAEPRRFNEGGHVGEIESPDSDAQTIDLISWTDMGNGCERFIVTFQSTVGAPATTPPSVSARFVDQQPILRVSLDATASVVVDQLIETALVDRIYVVRALEEDMFIDFHLRAPARAGVSTRESPGQVHIELLPGVFDFTHSPSVADRLIVTQPLEGQSEASPVTVTGYARGLSEGVVVLATAGTEILFDETVEPANTTSGWAEFETSLDLASGSVLIFVGEDRVGPSGLAGMVIPMTVE